MKKDDLVYLGHVLEQIEKIERTTKSISRQDFDSNEELKDATIRRLEIIGEAVKNISEDFKKDYPKVQWKRMAGTRDIIIHRYFEVDWDIVWEIVKINVSELKNQISDVKNRLEKASKKIL